MLHVQVGSFFAGYGFIKPSVHKDILASQAFSSFAPCAAERCPSRASPRVGDAAPSTSDPVSDAACRRPPPHHPMASTSVQVSVPVQLAPSPVAKLQSGATHSSVMVAPLGTGAV